MLLPGQSRQYTAFGETASSGSIDITELVTWSSTVPSIAGIDGGGQATAASPGITTIRAELDWLDDEVTLEVVNDPTDLEVTFTHICPATPSPQGRSSTTTASPTPSSFFGSSRYQASGLSSSK